MGLYNPAMVGTLTPPVIPVGGWIELGRTSGSAAATIDVSGLANKRYMMTLMYAHHSAGLNCNQRSGNTTIDTGGNYAERQSLNGGADTPLSSQNDASQWGTIAGNAGFGVGFWANLSAKEKLFIEHAIEQNTAGAGNAPNRFESVSKHVFTTNPLDILQKRASAGTFDSTSEYVILGWDPADTHTTNFWEELASVNGDGTSSFDTGTFTAKKYLWIQAYVQRSATANNTNFTVGNATLDTGSNYTRRRNVDGGTDDTVINQPSIPLSTIGTEEFYNIFIINNASNEKLVIIHVVNRGTAGAGNAPNRAEFVAKWTNTSDQLNIFGINSGGANTLSSTSQIKVWGSD